MPINIIKDVTAGGDSCAVHKPSLDRLIAERDALYAAMQKVQVASTDASYQVQRSANNLGGLLAEIQDIANAALKGCGL